MSVETELREKPRLAVACETSLIGKSVCNQQQANLCWAWRLWHSWFKVKKTVCCLVAFTGWDSMLVRLLVSQLR
jgi:hypothetical protein